ncbi:hypothetical protein [Flavobacterium eburneipallidum]|jgi:hypothetical protein|uniref:hypothetical protein n=1 Tax=Flavobacterium eburneipallidum TaxID=3003263 RepID=UPI0022ABF2F6|nr:hypothetical protein [Flavobacterium eburneipallidum]
MKNRDGLSDNRMGKGLIVAPNIILDLWIHIRSPGGINLKSLFLQLERQWK